MKQAITSPGWRVSILVCLARSSIAASALAANIDPAANFAWASQVGWVNHAPSDGGGVTVVKNGANGYLSGYAWAESIGWVKLGAGTGPYLNTSAANWGVNMDASGQLSGFAWSSQAGWINFRPEHTNVTVNTVNGEFSGYAWGENIGWLSFHGTAPAYGVRTSVFDILAAFGITNALPVGSDVHLDVQATAGREYRILASNDLAHISSLLYTTNPPGSFTFVDPGFGQTAPATRFYEVVEVNGVNETTNPAIYAAYARTMSTGAWYKLSMPVDLGPNNTLNGALGDQVKAGLGSAPLNEDRLYYLETNGDWQVLKLFASGTWSNTVTGLPASNAIPPAASFWLKRQLAGTPTNVVYAGPIRTNAAPYTFRDNAWHMIAWPFAKPKAEGTAVTGWGLPAAGAHGGTNSLSGDNLVKDAELLWLHTDGRWRMADGSSASDVELQAGEGYYYFNRGASFIWTPTE